MNLQQFMEKKVYVICLSLIHTGVSEACSDYNFVINSKKLNSVFVLFCFVFSRNLSFSYELKQMLLGLLPVLPTP